MRAARLIRLALLVQSTPGVTAAALARELEVSERTVIRDVQELQEAGLPVRSERGRTGGYRLAPGYRTRLTTLHPAEAETLYLSGLPGALRDLGMSDAAGAARLKLSATLLPSLRAAAEAPARRFHLDAPAWFREPAVPDVLPELARAVWQDRTVALRYARPGRPEVARVLEPYGLVLKAGEWYLVGRVPGGDGWRTYRVERVTALTGTGEPFERDPAFELADYWRADAAGFARALLRASVTVRVTERGLRLLPGLVDPAGAAGLSLHGTPDTGGWVTVELPVESEEVAFAQLVGLGAELEVLAPASLRARFREHAQALAALYR